MRVGVGAGRRRTAAVLLLVVKDAQEREQHLVLRTCELLVEFEYGALEVLDGARNAVFVYLLELIGDGITLLGEATVRLPILTESPSYGMACLGEVLWVVGAYFLAGGIPAIFLVVVESAEQREEYVEWTRVFRMFLEDCSLEVLHRVYLAIGIARLLELI